MGLKQRSHPMEGLPRRQQKRRWTVPRNRLCSTASFLCCWPFVFYFTLGIFGPFNVSAQDVPAAPLFSREARTIEDLSQEDRERVESRTLELIEQLGDNSYAVRQFAANEIQKIGMLAFEKLREAMLHPDPQIAATAQYLLHSMRQEWALDSDPLEIRTLLADYGNANAVGRASRIDRIAKMDQEAAVAALCRLCRYETHEFLSRHAALQLLSMKTKTEDLSPQRAKRIRQVIGFSQRRPCLWLQEYANQLESGHLNLEWWHKKAIEEHQDFVGRSQTTTRANAIRLYQWVCQNAVEKGQRKGALLLAQSMLELIAPTSHDLGEASYWALSIEFPEWIEDLAAKYPKLFSSYARLGYAWAESKLVRGDTDGANALSERVFYRGRSKDAPPISIFAERNSIAHDLMQRGLFDWSEREYSACIDTADPLNRATVVAYMDFSNLLSEGEKYLEAAKVWRAFSQRIETEPLYRRQIEATYAELYDGRAADAFVERFYFFSAKAAIKDRDRESARNYLRKAIEVYDQNSDAWIELYQLSHDDAERSQVRQDSMVLVTALRQKIEEAESGLLEGTFDRFARNRREQALSLNELAWLLCNTGGDLDEAMQASKRACEFAPGNSSYIDTLACVHFHRGELNEAVRLQLNAVQLEPNDRQLKRVLKKYQEKLAQLPKS